jgi:peptidyl-prolyl cis-trans isomerase C/foldase protein PrsA
MYVNNNKYYFVVLLVMLSGCFLSGCSNKSGPVQAVSDGAVVSTINGEPVARERFVRELKSQKRKYHFEGQHESNPNHLLLLKTNALNEIIRETLFQQQIEINKIRVSDEEVKKNFQQLMNNYQEDSFQKYLEAENLTMQEWQNKLKNNMLIKYLINKVVNSKVSVSEAELQEYFSKHSHEFQMKEQVRALHIMVETEEEARNILKQLTASKKEFTQLAQEHSLGPEGIKGGDLGYFESGHMPEEFDEIFKLKVNEISSIIHSPYGYHIFKVIDKKNERKMSFDESRKLAHKKLLQEREETAFQQWLKKLKDEASIKINYDILAQIE